VDPKTFTTVITQTGRPAPAAEPAFMVGDEPIDVPYTANEDAVITVTGNVEWTAEIISGMGATLAPGSDSGDGDGEVTVVFTENENETAREATVRVSTTAPIVPDSYDVTVTQAANPGEQSDDAAYVRVDATLADWAGEYLIVYEAQATGPNANNFGFTSFLVYDGSGNPPLDGGGNVLSLSSTKPGSASELATITGGAVVKTDTKVTVSGGQIAAAANIDALRVTIAKVEGGYSVKTTSGYYIGGGEGGATGGALAASKTFTAPAHVHNITIGDSNALNNTGITFHNCALIISSAATNNAMRVNAGTGRFGYWGEKDSLWGQYPVALYRRNAPVEE
jgi:hypothetical protein